MMDETDYFLTESLRDELKRPLGELVDNIVGIESDKLVSVGDTTTDRLLNDGIKPRIIVFDNKVGRKDITPYTSIKEFEALEKEVENPAGTLKKDAFKSLDDAFNSTGSTKILVHGEEDLLTLAAIHLAPIGWIVVYGQPNEGVVKVKINENIKDQINKILEEMKNGH